MMLPDCFLSFFLSFFLVFLGTPPLEPGHTLSPFDPEPTSCEISSVCRHTPCEPKVCLQFKGYTNQTETQRILHNPRTGQIIWLTNVHEHGILKSRGFGLEVSSKTAIPLY
ncbi:hypothetical protein PGTUg99_027623 [Puccinia graminis f. sp. tritici]|uniref:Uncharacterized protein n=1 Tax=Puccinia graminis f. sp. tritici TaxID=56615 RepID=A0A5B0REN0_PUCGR|nr:hypothetical protein PGTUg99_027623 [Puccinia graminis f. sp. tritici]